MISRLFPAALVCTLCAAVALRASTGMGNPLTDSPQPPQRLSETGLYMAGQPGTIDPRNRVFSPQYPLWSDGLTKKRWIYLPPNSAIDGRDEHAWQFPVGTRLWKEFSNGSRKVETRMLWKASAAGWVTAAYAWNEEGTEAFLAPGEGLLTGVEVAPGRRHAIPGRNDCAACHGQPSAASPLGFNLLQLSPDRDPNALHGETLKPGMLTLGTLIDERLLSGLRSGALAPAPRVRTESPVTRAALGYLAANCSMCHNGNGEITAVAPVIRYRDILQDGDAVARSLLGQRTRWQLPATAEGTTVLVHAGAPESSALVFRMRSRSPSSQMPPLGTRVRDDAAIDLMTRWISGELPRMTPRAAR